MTKVTDSMVILGVIGLLGEASEDEIAKLSGPMRRALEAVFNYADKGVKVEEKEGSVLRDLKSDEGWTCPIAIYDGVYWNGMWTFDKDEEPTFEGVTGSSLVECTVDGSDVPLMREDSDKAWQIKDAD